MVLKTGVDNSPKKKHNLRGEGMVSSFFFLLCFRFVLEHTSYQHPIVITFRNLATIEVHESRGVVATR